MAEGLDEHHRIVGGVLIVVRVFAINLVGLYFFSFRMDTTSKMA